MMLRICPHSPSIAWAFRLPCEQFLPPVQALRPHKLSRAAPSEPADRGTELDHPRSRCLLPLRARGLPPDGTSNGDSCLLLFHLSFASWVATSYRCGRGTSSQSLVYMFVCFVSFPLQHSAATLSRLADGLGATLVVVHCSRLIVPLPPSAISICILFVRRIAFRKQALFFWHNVSA